MQQRPSDLTDHAWLMLRAVEFAGAEGIVRGVGLPALAGAIRRALP
jgi:hypothetical protein